MLNHLPVNANRLAGLLEEPTGTSALPGRDGVPPLTGGPPVPR
jgi:hypothetical protein